MMSTWTKPIGRIVQTILSHNSRVIAILPIDDESGANLVVREFADILSRTGETVLVADLSNSGTRAAPNKVPYKSIWTTPESLSTYHRTEFNSGSLAGGTFRSVSGLKASFKNDFQHYTRILLELGALTKVDSNIDAMGPAAAADATYLIGRVEAIHRGNLQHITHEFKQLGIKLTGVILIEGIYPPTIAQPQESSIKRPIEALAQTVSVTT